jgi:hypothetical protein
MIIIAMKSYQWYHSIISESSDRSSFLSFGFVILRSWASESVKHALFFLLPMHTLIFSPNISIFEQPVLQYGTTRITLQCHCHCHCHWHSSDYHSCNSIEVLSKLFTRFGYALPSNSSFSSLDPLTHFRERIKRLQLTLPTLSRGFVDSFFSKKELVETPA